MLWIRPCSPVQPHDAGRGAAASPHTHRICWSCWRLCAHGESGGQRRRSGHAAGRVSQSRVVLCGPGVLPGNIALMALFCAGPAVLSVLQTSGRGKPHDGRENQHTLIRLGCNQQSLSHTLSLTAQPTQKPNTPHVHIYNTSSNQHWHYKTSIRTQTLITGDDQPTPAGHLSIPPPHLHRQQMHCPARRCTLGNTVLSVHICTGAVHGFR